MRQRRAACDSRSMPQKIHDAVAMLCAMQLPLDDDDAGYMLLLLMPLNCRCASDKPMTAVCNVSPDTPRRRRHAVS